MLITVDVAQVAHLVAFAPAVADLSGDGQRLLVVLDRPLPLPQVTVDVAQVAQKGGFLPPIVRSLGGGQPGGEGADPLGPVPLQVEVVVEAGKACRPLLLVAAGRTGYSIGGWRCRWTRMSADKEGKDQR